MPKMQKVNEAKFRFSLRMWFCVSCEKNYGVDDLISKYFTREEKVNDEDNNEGELVALTFLHFSAVFC